MTSSGSLLLFSALLALLFAFGCGDDFGTECTLPANPTIKEACEASSSTEERSSASASCVVENIIECDSRVCARYRGSTPFCTLSCSSDADCPGSAFCAEFVIGTGKRFCVKSEFQSF